jgi:hypothetical protein
MAKVHYVHKARKARPNNGIQPGDSYYWWATRSVVGGTYVKTFHYSRGKPKRSQLTNSPFKKAFYQLIETLEDSYPPTLREFEKLQGWLLDALNELIESEQGKLANLPPSLQESASGDKINDRISALEELFSQVEDSPLPEFTAYIEDCLEQLKGIFCDT